MRTRSINSWIAITATVFTVIALFSATSAQAQTATVSVSPTMVAPGSTASVAWSNGTGDPGDCVAVYNPDGSTFGWCFLNGTTSKSASSPTSGSLTLQMPSAAGMYKIQFFGGASKSVLATCSVTISTAASGSSNGPGFVDPLNDFSKTASMSNLTIDNSKLADFLGDAGRACRTTLSATGTLVYKLNFEASTFKIRMFSYATPSIKLKVLGSRDGATWQTLPADFSAPIATTNGWSYLDVTNEGVIPAGITNIQVEIVGTDTSSWDIEIGQVEVH